MKRTLFIVNSPFQALCAVCTIKSKGLSTPFFYIINGAGSFEKTKAVVQMYGYKYEVIMKEWSLFSLMKHLKTKEKSSNIFLGDYYSRLEYFIGVTLASYKACITYLDDGNSTLSMLPPVSKKRFNLSPGAVKWLLFIILSFAKRIKYSFRSIYDIKGKIKLPVEENNLSILTVSDSKVLKDTFIIGTDASNLVFKSIGYDDYLDRIMEEIKNLNEYGNILYCPHRRDKDSHENILISNNVELFNTDFSVEVDFCIKNIYPKYIIGFGSTALVTLKSIYPMADVYTVAIEFEDENLNNTYRSIERYMEGMGIKVISI